MKANPQAQASDAVITTQVACEVVSNLATTMTDAVYFGRRLEPKGRVVLHGFGQDPDSFAEYSAAMGPHPPLIYMCYMSLDPGVAKQLASLRQQLGGLDHYTVLQMGLSLPVEEILQGKREADMRAVCEALREHRQPIFVRLGYEFNLNHSKNPAGFQEAWRVFARMLRSKPGSDSVALAWCMTPDGDDRDLMAYYPGDEFVDWWSYDPFEPRHLTHRRTIEFLDAAREHRFPLLIGESTPRWLGARQGELSWNVWFKRYFEQLEKYPHIKAFSYIGWEWSRMVEKSDSPYSLHWWGDSRVWKDEYVFGKWKEELSKPLYVHGAGRDRILDLLGIQRSRRG
jgi:hypothetical protein